MLCCCIRMLDISSLLLLWVVFDTCARSAPAVPPQCTRSAPAVQSLALSFRKCGIAWEGNALVLLTHPEHMLNGS